MIIYQAEYRSSACAMPLFQVIALDDIYGRFLYSFIRVA